MEQVTERMRPNPDLCRFITVSEVASLAREDPIHLTITFAQTEHFGRLFLYSSELLHLSSHVGASLFIDCALNLC